MVIKFSSIPCFKKYLTVKINSLRVNNSLSYKQGSCHAFDLSTFELYPEKLVKTKE